MDAGAAGISSSQAPHQRGEQGEHIPSYFADAAETRALAEAVRRKGKRLFSMNPATKRDGLSEDDRALLVELADLSGAVVSWNDFGMGTPDGDSVLEFMEAQLTQGREIYAVARCQRPETRFTLKKLSAIFANSEAWVDLSAPRSGRQACGPAGPRLAGTPRRILGHGPLHGEHVGREGSRARRRLRSRDGCSSTSPRSVASRPPR